MFRWFLLSHHTDVAEKEKWMALTGKIIRKLPDGVGVIELVIGPYRNSRPVFLVDGVKVELIQERTRKSFRALHDVQKAVKYVRGQGLRVHGCVYSGHGGGVVFGPWSGRTQLCTVKEFNDSVLRELRPRVFLADSCYFGNMASLYEFSSVKSLQYVLGSPSFHPSSSILQTDAINQLTDGNVSRERLWAAMKRAVRQFHNRPGPPYVCLMLFSMDAIRKLPGILLRSPLSFGKHTMVHRDDHMLHDIYTAAKPGEVRSRLKDCVHGTRRDGRCVRIKSLTMYTEIPKEHKDAFIDTRWYKEMKRHAPLPWGGDFSIDFN